MSCRSRQHILVPYFCNQIYQNHMNQIFTVSDYVTLTLTHVLENCINSGTITSKCLFQIWEHITELSAAHILASWKNHIPLYIMSQQGIFIVSKQGKSPLWCVRSRTRAIVRGVWLWEQDVVNLCSAFACSHHWCQMQSRHIKNHKISNFNPSRNTFMPNFINLALATRVDSMSTSEITPVVGYLRQLEVKVTTKFKINGHFKA